MLRSDARRSENSFRRNRTRYSEEHRQGCGFHGGGSASMEDFRGVGIVLGEIDGGGVFCILRSVFLGLLVVEDR